MTEYELFEKINEMGYDSETVIHTLPLYDPKTNQDIFLVKFQDGNEIYIEDK